MAQKKRTRAQREKDARKRERVLRRSRKAPAPEPKGTIGRDVTVAVVPVTVWVPQSCEQELRSYASQLLAARMKAQVLARKVSRLVEGLFYKAEKKEDGPGTDKRKSVH